MKKLLIAVVLMSSVVASAIASADSDKSYYYQPKDNNEAQFKRDLQQCSYETSQRHKYKDPQKEALIVDCMIKQMGHTLVAKA